ncbi:putative MFS family arabinose efflux permease [Flavobacterium araucananum]|uniref:MFS transporter n=1 Tax=Flavobacterium araucananum TaxID=946678 RepID=A0A227PIZ6_9FLAO|nr:MFS transporter [Flavobacterium araucananum]OXG09076.1 MFS transporter [Flavobacterium araucananum]PWJ99732.1 putative MFS family arabinose efflux permease [Flavobacterium araucananum]
MSRILEKGQTIDFYKATVPIILSVFAIYLTIGLTLGIVPQFVQNDLKFSSLIVGLVIGLQPLTTLLTRAYFGKLTDTRGAKKSKLAGILFVMVAGIIYVLAALFSAYPLAALLLLLLARIVHGIAESLLVIGALTWGIGLVGPEKSGKVMTWNGIAMYGGIAVGAPLSIWMTQEYGIVYALAMIVILPVASWISTIKLPAIPVDPAHIRTPFYKVLGTIAKQGLTLAFSSIAFGCIASFIALFFTEKNWGDASLAFMIFGISYILTRVFFASFPDKYGGYKIAVISLLIEIAGQFLIYTSFSKEMALLGCGLTGIGFSLIFPSLGVLAIKKVTPQMRGTALGAYAAFFDLSLGLAGPLAGLIAGWFSYQDIYLFGSISCLLALLTLLFKRD